MPDILHRVGIQAPVEKVYRALTSEEGLAGWWTRKAKAPPGLGAALEFQFGDKGFNKMKVIELAPNKLVRWQCVDGAQEFIGTEVIFNLKGLPCRLQTDGRGGLVANGVHYVR